MTWPVEFLFFSISLKGYFAFCKILQYLPGASATQHQSHRRPRQESRQTTEIRQSVRLRVKQFLVQFQLERYRNDANRSSFDRKYPRKWPGKYFNSSKPLKNQNRSFIAQKIPTYSLLPSSRISWFYEQLPSIISFYLMNKSGSTRSGLIMRLILLTGVRHEACV